MERGGRQCDETLVPSLTAALLYLEKLGMRVLVCVIHVLRLWNCYLIFIWDLLSTAEATFWVMLFKRTVHFRMYSESPTSWYSYFIMCLRRYCKTKKCFSVQVQISSSICLWPKLNIQNLQNYILGSVHWDVNVAYHHTIFIVMVVSSKYVFKLRSSAV